MSDHGRRILDHLRAVDAELVAQGFPAISPWWWSTLERFYLSGRRTLVLRVGRRGGKSSTLCRVAVVEALFGEHHIPPGDVGTVPIVSTSRDEAAARLRTIEVILRALGVEFRKAGEAIELQRDDGAPVAFKVFAASIAGVSGFTAIAAICDEVAKWADKDTGANPAKEVLASLRPTMATQPRARLFLSSSPLSTLDAHYDAFEQGETPTQCVAYAPTWIANPSISEQDTRALEPDARVWAREYRALPQAAISAAFDPDAVDRAFRDPVCSYHAGERVLVLDPSSGRNDSFTYAVVGWSWPLLPFTAYVTADLTDEWGRVIAGNCAYAVDAHGKRIVRGDYAGQLIPFLQVEQIGGIDGAFWQNMRGDDVVDRLCGVCEEHAIRRVLSDQREALMLEAAFAARGYKFTAYDWTNSNKTAAVGLIRGWLRDGAITIATHEIMRKQLHAFSEKFTATGALTYGARTGHDDYAALLLTAAIADADGALSMSPLATRKPSGRNFVTWSDRGL
ncbi:hypothetical protein WMF20_04985 [Sorangium sp. So ce834]|uniref:hypothetical protein n=1 Tax=Sorangium sp. So ce834 TaxID=3133321 RepID=UPI003F5D5E7E